MAFWNRLKQAAPSVQTLTKKHVVGARTESGDSAIMTFDRTNHTFSGSIEGYDYGSILRDKQTNIYKIFELADYFTDADPIFKGIIKGVYTPFSIASGWQLIGASEQVKQQYDEYYDRIHLLDRLRSIFFQYYKYGNVYCY